MRDTGVPQPCGLEASGLAARQGRALLFRDLDLNIAPGEILGLGGPSGSGKTTLGRVLAGLHRPAAGRIRVDGNPHPARGRRAVQYLHQSPLMAMNPRWTMARVVSEGGLPGPGLTSQVGFDPDLAERYPHELSGGQLQRAAILRALAARPRYLIADEISAAMDPLSQLRIWQLLCALAADQGIGILAISHDEALLGRICHRQFALGSGPRPGG